MHARVYLLLDVKQGSSDEVRQELEGKSGVVIADALDGPPDIIIMVEAPDRQRVAELAMGALASVETATEGVRLLLARDQPSTGHRGGESWLKQKRGDESRPQKRRER